MRIRDVSSCCTAREIDNFAFDYYKQYGVKDYDLEKTKLKQWLEYHSKQNKKIYNIYKLFLKFLP